MVLLILPFVRSLHPLIAADLLLSLPPAIPLYLCALFSLTLLFRINLHNPSTVLRLVAALVAPFLLPFSGLLVISKVLLLLRCLGFNTLLRSKLLPCSLGLWRW